MVSIVASPDFSRTVSRSAPWVLACPYAELGKASTGQHAQMRLEIITSSAEAATRRAPRACTVVPASASRLRAARVDAGAKDHRVARGRGIDGVLHRGPRPGRNDDRSRVRTRS